MTAWDWTRLLSGLEPDPPLGLERLGKEKQLLYIYRLDDVGWPPPESTSPVPRMSCTTRVGLTSPFIGLPEARYPQNLGGDEESQNWRLVNSGFSV